MFFGTILLNEVFKRTILFNEYPIGTLVITEKMDLIAPIRRPTFEKNGLFNPFPWQIRTKTWANSAPFDKFFLEGLDPNPSVPKTSVTPSANFKTSCFLVYINQKYETECVQLAKNWPHPAHFATKNGLSQSLFAYSISYWKNEDQKMGAVFSKFSSKKKLGSISTLRGKKDS